MYLTLSVDDDTQRAEQKLNGFLENYYGQPAAVVRSFQACYAGTASGVAATLAAYAQAGVAHFVLRFVGEPERHLDAVATARAALGWSQSVAM